ncbi:MAG: hypothetical protein QNL61_07715 [Crocinitomicaceae bacterium]
MKASQLQSALTGASEEVYSTFPVETLVQGVIGAIGLFSMLFKVIMFNKVR